jgi:AraC-like DNA-binding protein
LEAARIIASLDMLASDRSIKAIAHTLQFSSAAAYIAAFRDMFSCTPNTFIELSIIQDITKV